MTFKSFIVIAKVVKDCFLKSNFKKSLVIAKGGQGSK